jgi:hypothetical protein
MALVAGITGHFTGHLTGRIAAWAVAVSLAAARAEAADLPLAVKRLFPPGGTVGGTVVVVAEGTFPRWPVRVWTDRGGTDWKPLEEKGRFEVRIAASESLGVHAVRFYDEQAAAGVRRFVVGADPEILEAEPNDRPQEPQAVSTLPVVVNGVLEKAGDVDCYAVELAAGQTLVAAVDAHGGPESPLDAVLELVDERGNYLARNLDARGLDPRIVSRASRSGRHVVRLYGFPSDPNQTIGYSGGPEHVYRLTLTTGGFVAAALPAAVSRSGATSLVASGWNLPDGIATVSLAAPDAAAGSAPFMTGATPTAWAGFPGVAGTLELPVVAAERLPVMTAEAAASIEPPLVASAVFTAEDQNLTQRITARKDQPLLIALAANTAGSEAEAVLDVRNADGTSLLSRSDRDPPMAWTPPADGDYGFAVRDRRGGFGPSHFFRLSVLPSEPAIAATAEADTRTAAIGDTVDLVIAVERLWGWKEPVEFALLDPPPGISADPVTSAAEGESAKKVTLTIKAGAAYAGPVAVAARRPTAAADAAGTTAMTPAEAVASVGFGKKRWPHLWLTVPPAGPAAAPPKP